MSNQSILYNHLTKNLYVIDFDETLFPTKLYVKYCNQNYKIINWSFNLPDTPLKPVSNILYRVVKNKQDFEYFRLLNYCSFNRYNDESEYKKLEYVVASILEFCDLLEKSNYFKVLGEFLNEILSENALVLVLTSASLKYISTLLYSDYRIKKLFLEPNLFFGFSSKADISKSNKLFSETNKIVMRKFLVLETFIKTYILLGLSTGSQDSNQGDETDLKPNSCFDIIAIGDQQTDISSVILQINTHSDIIKNLRLFLLHTPVVKNDDENVEVINLQSNINFIEQKTLNEKISKFIARWSLINKLNNWHKNKKLYTDKDFFSKLFSHDYYVDISDEPVWIEASHDLYYSVGPSVNFKTVIDRSDDGLPLLYFAQKI